MLLVHFRTSGCASAQVQLRASADVTKHGRQEGSFVQNYSNFVKYTQIYAMKCSGSNGKHWLYIVCRHYIPFVMNALGYW